MQHAINAKESLSVNSSPARSTFATYKTRARRRHCKCDGVGRWFLLKCGPLTGGVVNSKK